MSENDSFALVWRPSTAVEKAAPGPNRILSGMVIDMLSLAKQQRRTKPRVVLVDDAPEMLDLLGWILKDRFDAEVLSFKDGETAWRELQREDPDILITDILRPGDSMDGWTMIPLLAHQKVQYPVLVVSAYSEFAERDDHEANKADSAKFRELLQDARRTLNISVLSKGRFSGEEFLGALEVCLQNRGNSPGGPKTVVPVSTRENRRSKLFLVNDEQWFLEMVTSAIVQKFPEIQVESFEDSKKAWRELQREDPELLITDDIMDRTDELNGEELVRRLVNIKASYPIIVTSGWPPTIKWVQQYLGKHSNISLLPVPFTAEQLYTELSKYLRADNKGVTASVDLRWPEPLGFCPKCGGHVIETETNYACERSPHCKFRFNKIIAQQPINREQTRKLLHGGSTDLLERFVSKGGKIFRAYLVLKEGKVMFRFPPRTQDS